MKLFKCSPQAFKGSFVICLPLWLLRPCLQFLPLLRKRKNKAKWSHLKEGMLWSESNENCCPDCRPKWWWKHITTWKWLSQRKRGNLRFGFAMKWLDAKDGDGSQTITMFQLMVKTKEKQNSCSKAASALNLPATSLGCFGHGKFN